MLAIRVLAGCAMILFAVPLYTFGFVFVFGDRSEPALSRAFAVYGMQGIYAPIFLCGLHLVASGPKRSLAFRVILVALLALSLAVCVIGLLPLLFADPPQPEAGQLILSASFSAALFGWPIIAACFRGR
ncbi:MAG: hypothetical protein EAZ40_01110 [Rhodobacterales bacterium]|nr:MAG: hypothetical protein EAZ40_01110 [Rhodobacterales bacterium]